MTHEVVVVGGGIGGLTVAALLAARGVDVCLLEREAQVGGCVAPFEMMNYSFEPGAGLYAMWGSGEIHERVFAELPVKAPEIKSVSPAYLVRLPDGSDIPIESADEVFYASLQKFFPECAAAAVKFYQLMSQQDQVCRRLLARSLSLSAPGKFECGVFIKLKFVLLVIKVFFKIHKAEYFPWLPV
jgi:phytoene dehydrogenase-like protein